jgi:glycosyltransferase involved in cell wall biosynthesis
VEGLHLARFGPDNGYLEALTRLTEDLSIRHGVIFANPLYGEDKLRALVNAVLFVLPSSYETFPVSVLEAVVCGTPEVVTDRRGIAHLVEEVGRVAEHNDASLSDVLLEVLSDTSLRTGLAGTGRALLRDGYTMRAVTDRLEELYEKCPTQEVQR